MRQWLDSFDLSSAAAIPQLSDDVRAFAFTFTGGFVFFSFFFA